MNKKPRLKTCKSCREEFQVLHPLQSVCGVACAVKLAREKQEKASQKARMAETKAAKERLKSRADYLKECQQVVNKYVRLRDYFSGCISCNKPKEWQGQWHASHFRSVGSSPHLRFNLWNIHKSCSVCNNYMSGNIMNYRIKLIQKIGVSRVEWLESENSLVTYDIEYLKRLKAIFLKKCKRLERKIDEMHS